MIEALVDELMGCGDADLDERVRALELERRRIEAEMAVTIGEIGRRRSYLDDGHRSLKAYLRGTCNWSDAESARVTRLTEAAGAVPGLVEALHAGRVGTPQTNELAVAHTNRRVSERLVEFAPMLLDHAERLSFFEFRACVKRFVTLADLDGAHHDLDVSLCLDGSGGDPLINAELEAIFRHFCDLEYDADIAARRDRYGNDAELHPLPRTGTQRGYDALVAIMRHAVANIEASHTPKAAGFVVNILTDQHTEWNGNGRTDGTIMLPVGARPPTFPDQPDPSAAPEQSRPEQSDRSGAASAVPHDVERHLDHWATSAATDDERACRRLRAVAIREVAVRGDPLHLTHLDRAIEAR